MKTMMTYTKTLLMAVMAMMFLGSCDSSDQYEADLLINGDWQGYLGAYYSDRWGVTGTTYETVMRFNATSVGATSGRGYEVDYDTRSPFRDYAYCGFMWSIVDGVITLIYDDSKWNPVYISRYTLNSSYFAGYMNDGTRRDIRFELENVNFGYWNRYSQGIYYDDYGYYDGAVWARTRSAEATDDSRVQPTDSLPIKRVANGKSILSGAFAQ